MQQRVLAGYCLERKTKASTGKLIHQSLCRITNGVSTSQNTMFAEQEDVLSIVMFQVAFDVASLATFEVIFEHLSRRTRFHS